MSRSSNLFDRATEGIKPLVVASADRTFTCSVCAQALPLIERSAAKGLDPDLPWCKACRAQR